VYFITFTQIPITQILTETKVNSNTMMLTKDDYKDCKMAETQKVQISLINTFFWLIIGLRETLETRFLVYTSTDVGSHHSA